MMSTKYPAPAIVVLCDDQADEFGGKQDHCTE